MRIESWDRASLQEQQQIIGRRKTSGAPLTGQREFDRVDLEATIDGVPVIERDAHIRLAAPDTNGGVHLLRRGYSFTDGIDPTTGELDAGLFFICFQRRLASLDTLNEYIRHTASAVFAVPPGVQPGDYLGRSLVE
jgi:deferrochelatase/peroxidase EfeB